MSAVEYADGVVPRIDEYYVASWNSLSRPTKILRFTTIS